MLSRFLASTAERAEDLKQRLAAFDGSPLLVDEFGPVLSSFQQLSSQLKLLEERRAAESNTILQRHFVVPAAASGVPVRQIPELLSTGLEMEQIAEAASTAREADAGAATAAPWSSEDHNAAVQAAHAHLASAALQLGLPGAQALSAEDQKKNQPSLPPGGSSSSGRVPGNSGSSSDPPSEEAHAESARQLISALRTGEGLKRPAPRPVASQPESDLEPSSKRPRP